MGLYSRNKGKRGERMWASFCREQGYDVRRTAQYRGNTGAAGDVEGLPYIHVECKYVQALNIRTSMEQSVRDAEAEGKGKLPIVASKRSKEPWLVTMQTNDFVTLISRIEDLGRLTTEHKKEKKFSVRKYLQEVKNASKDTGIELVSIRYERGDMSLITMYADDWFTLYREWETGMDLKRRNTK